MTDPSPGLGWRGSERAPLEGRGRPNLALFLAVVHHLAITGNLPLREVVAWMRSLDAVVVVEFPPRTDPMVARLLSGKGPDANPDYDLETFESLLSERFSIGRREQLAGDGRVLYVATPAA